MNNQNSKITHRNCPICSCPQAEVLHTMNFTLATGSLLPATYAVVSCNQCGFVYANTPANQTVYDEYYANYSKYEDPAIASGGGHTLIDAQRIDETFSLLEQYIPNKQAKILDIGCGNGWLLKNLQQRGYNNVHGIDPSMACIDYLNNYITGGGNYMLRLSEIYANSQTLGKYDFIILSHVLEHVADLHTAIRSIWSILAKNGSVYIEVPDASRYISHNVVPFYYFDCEHINHFDKCSLENLAIMNLPNNENSANTFFAMVASGEKELQVSQAVRYPAVFGVFKITSGEIPRAIKQCAHLIQSVKAYIELSKINNEFTLLQQLASSRQPVILWGAGSYTQRLLQDSPLSKCNIVAIVDRDSKKHGLVLQGIKIDAPEIIAKQYSDCLILISAAIYAEDIRSEIIAMGLTNKVLVAQNNKQYDN